MDLADRQEPWRQLPAVEEETEDGGGNVCLADPLHTARPFPRVPTTKGAPPTNPASATSVGPLPTQLPCAVSTRTHGALAAAETHTPSVKPLLGSAPKSEPSLSDATVDVPATATLIDPWTANASRAPVESAVKPSDGCRIHERPREDLQMAGTRPPLGLDVAPNATNPVD